MLIIGYVYGLIVFLLFFNSLLMWNIAHMCYQNPRDKDITRLGEQIKKRCKNQMILSLVWPYSLVLPLFRFITSK